LLKKSDNAGQDLVGGFGPNERFGRFVVGAQRMPDGLFECAGAAMNATANLFFSQQRKKARAAQQNTKGDVRCILWRLKNNFVPLPGSRPDSGANFCPVNSRR
jgi:hypothetical protein